MTELIAGMVTDILKITISRDEIRKFCNAVGEENALYHDVNVARAVGYKDIVIPPTYLTLLWQHFKIPWLHEQTLMIQTEQKFTYCEILTANVTYMCHIELLSTRKRAKKQFLKHRLVVSKNEQLLATSDSMIVLDNH